MKASTRPTETKARSQPQPWVLSNDDGTVCAVNRAVIDKAAEKAATLYTNHGKRPGPWKEYGGRHAKNDDDDNGNPQPIPGRYAHACLKEFNPLKMPSRI